MTPRLLPLWFAAAACVAMLTAAEDAKPAPKLGSSVFRFAELPAKPTGVGERRDVANRPTATIERFECHISTLNPGKMSHPPHQHPQEEFIILEKGTLDVFINGKVQRVGPGSLLFFASNDLHNVTNVGAEPATYFVFNLSTAATAHAPAKPAAESAPATALKSAAFDWQKLAVKPTKVGERRDILDSPTVTWTNFEAHVTTIRPGEMPHAPHHHADEEIVLVKEGTIEATVNGVAMRGGPGSIFLYGSNDEHGMKNVGTTNATYHVIRVVTDVSAAAAKKAG